MVLHKPRAVHLTVDFIQVASFVILAFPVFSFMLRASIYSKNTVEVSLRPFDGTKTHDLVDEPLGLHSGKCFLPALEFLLFPCAHVKPFFVDIDLRVLPSRE